MSRHTDRVHDAVRQLDHPTADDLVDHFRHAPDAPSRATIYRALGRLVESGRLIVHTDGDQSRYDPVTEPHAHLHCTRCGRLEDTPLTATLDATFRDMATTAGMTLERTTLELNGTCRDCHDEQRGPTLHDRSLLTTREETHT